ncbi:hypothetical protein WI90_00055 [Burkholderia ubonensis]|nr:hypothetical protein WI90_00055 [Burkholderia ubonensis]
MAELPSQYNALGRSQSAMPVQHVASTTRSEGSIINTTLLIFVGIQRNRDSLFSGADEALFDRLKLSCSLKCLSFYVQAP